MSVSQCNEQQDANDGLTSCMKTRLAIMHWIIIGPLILTVTVRPYVSPICIIKFKHEKTVRITSEIKVIRDGSVLNSLV